MRICGQIKKNNKLDIKNKNVIEKKNNLRLDVIIKKKKMKKINKKVVTVLIKIFILIKS